MELGFARLPGGIRLGGTATTSVAIADDDDPDVRVSFGSASYSVPEGATTTIEIVLSADPERTVTVPITKAGLGGLLGRAE